jgi:hypothetical protein
VTQSNLLFIQRGRYNNSPNPQLDIILTNVSTVCQVLLSFGIEVISARYRIISAGSIEKITLEDTERYKVEFPIPKYVIGTPHGGSTSRKLLVNSTEYKEGHGALVIGEIDSPDSVFLPEWDWAETPIISMAAVNDPVVLSSGNTYRFMLEIDKSERMPTDTLLRLLIRTNSNNNFSENIYFLKP